jgi:hypothetical protein
MPNEVFQVKTISRVSGRRCRTGHPQISFDMVFVLHYLLFV